MQIFLIIYLILFLSLAMVLPSYRVWKTTGITPYKLGNSDPAHDYIGRWYRFEMLAIGLVVISFALLPSLCEYLIPISNIIYKNQVRRWP